MTMVPLLTPLLTFAFALALALAFVPVPVLVLVFVTPLVSVFVPAWTESTMRPVQPAPAPEILSVRASE